MLGISTCWWDERTISGDRIIQEALDFGLEAVELEYRLTYSHLRQMKSLLNHSIKVCSIHNIFPRPEILPEWKESRKDLFLSATDRDQREKAVDFTIKTIQHAHELEAPVVVLHLGRVDLPGSIDRFRQLNKDHLILEEMGRQFVKEHKKLRKIHSSSNFDAVLSSLDLLNREAEKLSVFLGIENRFYFQEIPDYEEIGKILNEFDGGNIRYWHDVGHAHAQEIVGIQTQKDLLESYSSKAAGFHLHDANGLDDHLPPGEGEIDLKNILSYFNASQIKVIEVNYKAGRQRLKKGIEYTKRLLRLKNEG
jgi:sugar phosphate isomerase/epimerase